MTYYIWRLDREDGVGWYRYGGPFKSMEDGWKHVGIAQEHGLRGPYLVLPKQLTPEDV
jgi:hypothetical protein